MEPSKSARKHAIRVLGRDLPEPDPRPTWQQHADRAASRTAGQAQEPVAGSAERARAEGLASRASARARGRRSSRPPVPEWARRAAAGAGYDLDGPGAAA